MKPIDEIGYVDHYKKKPELFSKVNTTTEYLDAFERWYLRPFHKGGCVFDGEAFQGMMSRLDEFVRKQNKMPNEVTILDAGSGCGYFSIYLACKGYNVHGVEIAYTGVERGQLLAKKLGVENYVTFHACSLENIKDIPDESIDIVVGYNTLHHFIKYNDVMKEIRRVMTPTCKGLFVDPFGENIFKNLFQNKERMEKLGDVLLTKKNTEDFFNPYIIKLIPFSWFGLLNKLLHRHVFYKNFKNFNRKLAKLFFLFDQVIPKDNRLSLWLAGTIITEVDFSKPN